MYIPEKPKPVTTRSLFMLMGVNIGFAVCVQWGWTFVYMLLGEAMSWATWRALGMMPDIFEYPYIMLWLLPMLAVLVARVLAEAGSSRGAHAATLVPLIFFSLIIGLYHILPH